MRERLLDPPANDEMVEGYLEGFRDDRDELPNGSNYGEAYKHGWRNGRDDRLGHPRATAQQLRMTADAILRASPHSLLQDRDGEVNR